MASVLSGLDPYHAYGLKPAPGGSPSSMAPTAGQDGSTPPLWSPDHPLFWFGALAAVVFGLAAASTSTSVRLGPFQAAGSVSAGKKE